MAPGLGRMSAGLGGRAAGLGGMAPRFEGKVVRFEGMTIRCEFRAGHEGMCARLEGGTRLGVLAAIVTPINSSSSGRTSLMQVEVYTQQIER